MSWDLEVCLSRGGLHYVQARTAKAMMPASAATTGLLEAAAPVNATGGADIVIVPAGDAFETGTSG